MRRDMTISGGWRKSSYSDGGDGNNCVEVASSPTHISLRDTKALHRGGLTFSAPAFLPFLDHLKSPRPRTP
ncbi:hypothetical protein GCM10010259_28540 [Streptomyces daghestanicus]|uniref:DUF397 domain-containing protein n=2 Tax=Streptomyces daghestanicus TaxID=66885 RepID=A0ABQ3QA65_9ACTN|nr:hypothetical protein GCM10010259_28540 [Streptomyces daghestanicus]GHI34122.1 hypothetical protein Sdagh_58520 [Streptomyces daghestanicus]